MLSHMHEALNERPEILLKLRICTFCEYKSLIPNVSDRLPATCQRLEVA